MIAKAEWFKVRKWGGWGLSPATKEGWIYVGAFVAITALVQFLTRDNPQLQQTALLIMVGLISLDVTETMMHLKKDERESAHEAVAERNAGWFMIASLTAYIAYQSAQSAISGNVEVDWVLIAIILGAAAVKSVTYWKLER